MFESRKQEYSIASPIVTKDKYNCDQISYDSQGTAYIYIVAQDRTLMTQNELNLYTGTLVGYTDNTDIEINWLIGEKYVVTSTLPHRDGLVLYLKEFNNGK